MLRANGFKWIDIYSLVEKICKIQNPSTEVIKVKYFTAPIISRFSIHGQKSNESQNAYHRALKQLRNDEIEIIEGFHTVERGTPPVYKKPIDINERVQVWDFEEKQTDVNIAMHMYRDSLSEVLSQQVLMSNDSDLESALKFIKEDRPHIEVGLIIPVPKPEDPDNARPVTKYLDNYSDWTRKYILDEECQESLLPDKVPTRKKPIIKPDYW
tara:strand:- start:35694 stop:36329 length:636 start_codon:yes stop_codon:yes gene_type:complete